MRPLDCNMQRAPGVFGYAVALTVRVLASRSAERTPAWTRSADEATSLASIGLDASQGSRMKRRSVRAKKRNAAGSLDSFRGQIRRAPGKGGRTESAVR